MRQKLVYKQEKIIMSPKEWEEWSYLSRRVQAMNLAEAFFNHQMLDICGR
jgi:hypothetical protein